VSEPECESACAFVLARAGFVTTRAFVVMAKKDAQGDRRFAPYWHIYLKGNPLSESALKSQVAALKSSEVHVHLDEKE